MNDRMRGYPGWFPWLLWSVLLLLAATGVALLPGAAERRLAWDLAWRLPPGWGLGAGATHAGLAFAMLVLFGALAPLHMRAGWRRRQNRLTGTLLVAAFATLALTALGIYYVADEVMGLWASVLHSLVGAVLLVPLTVHARRRRRAARQRVRDATEDYGRQLAWPSQNATLRR